MSISALGIVCIVLGILALLAPGLTGLSIAMVLGVLVLIGGIARIAWAFKAESLGKGTLKFILGGFTALCGMALIGNPLFASGALTVILAVYFILDGVFEISAGSRIGMNAGGGWLYFGGIVSLLLGFMIWSQFPLSGAPAMGILLGIKLFLIGLAMVTVGSTVRGMRRKDEEIGRVHVEPLRREKQEILK